MVTWCSRAVNCAFLSFLAASRTRSNPLGSLSRLCVRYELDCSMFSLVPALPSITSAGSCSAFVRLLRQYYGGVRLPAAVHMGLICLWLSPTGPLPFGRGQPRGLSVLAHGVSKRAWGLRLRRVGPALAVTCTAVWSSGSF